MRSASDMGAIKKTAFKQMIERLGGFVDLVKMDCEGGEWEILSDSESWCNVRFVTAEYHLMQQYKHEDIIRRLQERGFKIIRQNKALSCGIVWAERLL